MFNPVHNLCTNNNFPITNNTWVIFVEDNSKYYNGELRYDVFSAISKNNIHNRVENLLISFFLFEPSFLFDMTKWVEQSLNFISQKNIFPNLKHVYILYVNATIDLDIINSRYIIKKHKLNYLFLKSTLTPDITSNFKLNDWTNHNYKAIFLLGRLTGLNRFPVIYEFYKNNQLDLLNYSLDFNYMQNFNSIEEYISSDYVKNFISTLYKDYSIDEFVFKQILQNLQKTLPDDIYFYNVKNNFYGMNSVFDGAQYDYPAIWFDACLVIVAETYYDSNGSNLDNFTEKIWKPILTKKPFVLINNKDYLYNDIEKLGFKTFLNYTDYPEKDTAEYKNIDHYPKLGYKRICSFLKNVEKNKSLIKNDIEYNYQLYKSLSEHHWNELYNFFPEFKKISKFTLCKMFMLGQDNFYDFTLDN